MNRLHLKKRLADPSTVEPRRQNHCLDDLASMPIVGRYLMSISATFIFVSLLLVLFFRTRTSVSSVEIHEAEVVNSYPHDPKAFTQGLLHAGNETLFESTGLYGQSSVRRVNLRTGKVEALHRMEPSHFGEGLTLLNNRLFQVMWRKNTVIIYARHNLSEIGRSEHNMRDGWGLTTDGTVLFGTDGTSTLYHLDPQRMRVLEKHVVRYRGREVHSLNELEFIHGEIWANVWQTDCIVRISKDGDVRGWVIVDKLRKGLVEGGVRDVDVLNGIAWDKRRDRIYGTHDSLAVVSYRAVTSTRSIAVTGKLWPKLYEIKLIPSMLSALDVDDLCIPPSL